MTKRDQLLEEITKLPDDSLDAVLFFIKSLPTSFEIKNEKQYKLTPHGRKIYSEKELAERECPYPYEADL